MVAVDCERHMKCDNVGTAGYFVEGVPVVAAFGELSWRVAQHYAHAQRACPVLDNGAYMAYADDA